MSSPPSSAITPNPQSGEHQLRFHIDPPTDAIKASGACGRPLFTDDIAIPQFATPRRCAERPSKFTTLTRATVEIVATWGANANAASTAPISRNKSDTHPQTAKGSEKPRCAMRGTAQALATSGVRRSRGPSAPKQGAAGLEAIALPHLRPHTAPTGITSALPRAPPRRAPPGRGLRSPAPAVPRSPARPR